MVSLLLTRGVRRGEGEGEGEGERGVADKEEEEEEEGKEEKEETNASTLPLWKEEGGKRSGCKDAGSSSCSEAMSTAKTRPPDVPNHISCSLACTMQVTRPMSGCDAMLLTATTSPSNRGTSSRSASSFSSSSVSPSSSSLSSDPICFWTADQIKTRPSTWQLHTRRP